MLTRRCFSSISASANPIRPNPINRYVVKQTYPAVPLQSERAEWSQYIDRLRQSNPGLNERIRALKAQGHSLSFAWVTPKSLSRGLEGGILARLLSSPGLNLIATQMYAPSNEFVDEYVDAHSKHHRFQPFVDFVNRDLRPCAPDCISRSGYPNHMLLMLFTGKNVRQQIISDVIGSKSDESTHMATSSKTIRGSYGDARVDPVTGMITDFQPALVGAHSDDVNEGYLRVFSKYSFADGGILTVPAEQPEFSNAMVIIKPDSLIYPSARPGHIMDLFSSTGLTLIGSSTFSMSVAQAREFYGFLEQVFQRKLAKDVEKTLHSRLDGAFEFKVPDEVFTVTTALLMKQHAQQEVARIISFMTGVQPPEGATHSALSIHDQLKRGPAKCLALLYRGKDAIATVRSKLGSTDPSAALPGTVRFDYGDDIMRNGAHASDSQEALVREMKIIKFGQGKGTAVKKIIDLWLDNDSSSTSHL